MSERLSTADYDTRKSWYHFASHPPISVFAVDSPGHPGEQIVAFVVDHPGEIVTRGKMLPQSAALVAGALEGGECEDFSYPQTQDKIYPDSRLLDVAIDIGERKEQIREGTTLIQGIGSLAEMLGCLHMDGLIDPAEIPQALAKFEMEPVVKRDGSVPGLSVAAVNDD